MVANDAQPRVPAIARATRLLEIVADAEVPLLLADLARQLELPKSSVLNLCSALVAERFLLRGADRSYRLGPRIAELAGSGAQTERTVRLIGISVQSGHNPFFAAEIAAAEREALLVGARLEAVQADQNASNQERQIREFVDSGADVIVVDPVDSQALQDAGDYARSNGVPIIAINGAAVGFDGAVTTDNTQAGFLAGQHLSRILRPGSRIAIIDGTHVTAIADRIDGFQRAISESGDLTIVTHVTGDNTSETGDALATAILNDGRRIDAFFAINDPTARGVSQACSRAGITVPVIGVDGSAEAVDEIRNGGRIIATAAQDPSALAREGVRLGIEIASGGRPRERTKLLPTYLVTAADIETYRPW